MLINQCATFTFQFTSLFYFLEEGLWLVDEIYAIWVPQWAILKYWFGIFPFFFLLFNMFSRKFAVEIKPVDDTKMWPPRDRHVIRLWSWDLPRTWLVKNACDLNILVLPWQLNAKNEILFQDVSDVFLFLKRQSEKGWQINRQSIG